MKVVLLFITWAQLALCSHTIPIYEIDDAFAKHFMEKQQVDQIVYVPKGTKIPLHLMLDGDVVSLQQGFPSMFEVRKDLYVKKESGAFLFSLDNFEWKGLEQFITGKIEANIENSKDGLQAGVRGDVWIRK